MRTDVEAGKNVSAYIKDKWQPVLLVELGYKWAKVRIGGKNYNSKVLATALRPISQERSVVATVEPVKIEGLRIEEDEHYVKIKNGNHTVAVFVRHYKQAAQVAFEAIKNLDTLV